MAYREGVGLPRDRERDPEYDARRILARDLYLAFHHSRTADHFNAQLFRLMHKADPGNLVRLGIGFPLEAAVFNEWYGAPNEAAFFDRYPLHEILREPERSAYLQTIMRGLGA